MDSNVITGAAFLLFVVGVLVYGGHPCSRAGAAA